MSGLSYPLVFFVNWAIECVALWMILRGASWQRIFCAEFLLNLITHPAVWFGLYYLPGSYFVKLIQAETAVFAMEIYLALILYRGCGTKRRIVAAVFTANLATLLMTFLI